MKKDSKSQGYIPAENEMGDFLKKLRYKFRWYQHVELEDTPLFADAKDICADCRTRTDGISHGKATWICPSCRRKHNTDRNAARVILLYAKA